MESKLRKITLLFFIAGCVENIVSVKPKSLYVLFIDFTHYSTIGRVYKMKNQLAIPIKYTGHRECSWILNVTRKTEDIMNEFISCLDDLSSHMLINVEPKNVFPVLTGSDYIDELITFDNDKFQIVMNKMENELARRNYSKGKNGFIQVLKNNEKYDLTAMASQYNGLEMNKTDAKELPSIIFLNDYSLDFIQPVPNNEKTSLIFDNFTVKLFDKKFHVNVLSLKCFGYKALSTKYYFHMFKDAEALEYTNLKPKICQCGDNRHLHINKNFEPECYNDIFSEFQSNYLNYSMVNDIFRVKELLKKLFCSGFQKDITCPIDDPNRNILLPIDQRKPIHLVGKFYTVLRQYMAKHPSDLAKKMEHICFPTRESNTFISDFCKWSDIYVLFIMKYFTYDLKNVKIMPYGHTWHLGKAMQLYSDVKELMDYSSNTKMENTRDSFMEKFITTIILPAVLVSSALLIIFVILYLLKVDRSSLTDQI